MTETSDRQDTQQSRYPEQEEPVRHEPGFAPWGGQAVEPPEPMAGTPQPDTPQPGAGPRDLDGEDGLGRDTLRSHEIDRSEADPDAPAAAAEHRADQRAAEDAAIAMDNRESSGARTEPQAEEPADEAEREQRRAEQMAQRSGDAATDGRGDAAATMDMRSDEAAMDMRSDEAAMDMRSDEAAMNTRSDEAAMNTRSDWAAMDMRSDEAAMDMRGDATATGEAAMGEAQTRDAAAYGNGSTDDVLDRWQELQLRFVDDPRGATTDAAALVQQAIDGLTRRKEELDRLVAQTGDMRAGNVQNGDGPAGGNGDARAGDETERLRTALRGYRDLVASTARQ